MRSESDIAAFIAVQPEMRTALRSVAALNLPDCWIAAGFIRNAVWDHLHGRPFQSGRSDVDVIYFDPANVSPQRDAALEAALRGSDPAFDWSVKNQTRMHTRNQDAPYRDCADAMMHWPEHCTAIAARMTNAGVEILAPLGVDDVLHMRVRPTPAFAQKLPLYRQRLIDKAWRDHWPQVEILGA